MASNNAWQLRHELVPYPNARQIISARQFADRTFFRRSGISRRSRNIFAEVFYTGVSRSPLQKVFVSACRQEIGRYRYRRKDYRETARRLRANQVRRIVKARLLWYSS